MNGQSSGILAKKKRYGDLQSNLVPFFHLEKACLFAVCDNVFYFHYQGT